MQFQRSAHNNIVLLNGVQFFLILERHRIEFSIIIYTLYKMMLLLKSYSSDNYAVNRYSRIWVPRTDVYECRIQHGRAGRDYANNSELLSASPV